ncbi:MULTISPECIES: ABC transporter permease [Amycolatopsis]|uniref:ABC transporter permease n=1 Tax=Amycolatopsis TaxID=1813 RepID=UPI003D73DE14
MVTRFIINRLLQSVVVVFGAVVISFLLTNTIGRPADVIGGPQMTAEARAALNAELGYDKPLAMRFMHYLSGIFQGDFGNSYRTGSDAMGEVVTAFPNTLILVVLAILLAAALALMLTIFSARHRESRTDRFIRRTVGALQGMPEFWLGLMLILVFSANLQLLPSFGFYNLSSVVLPVVTLALPTVPTLYRVFRGQMLDVLGNDFVEAMRARGLSERVIVYRHALRNMLGPSVNFTALQLGYLISACVIVETIFSWPGIGNLMISAVLTRDFAVVQATIIMVAAFYVLLNLISDIFILVSDPRVRMVKA